MMSRRGCNCFNLFPTTSIPQRKLYKYLLETKRAEGLATVPGIKVIRDIFWTRKSNAKLILFRTNLANNKMEISTIPHNFNITNIIYNEKNIAFINLKLYSFNWIRGGPLPVLRSEGILILVSHAMNVWVFGPTMAGNHYLYRVLNYLSKLKVYQILL